MADAVERAVREMVQRDCFLGSPICDDPDCVRFRGLVDCLVALVRLEQAEACFDTYNSYSSVTDDPRIEPAMREQVDYLRAEAARLAGKEGT